LVIFATGATIAVNADGVVVLPLAPFAVTWTRSR
jgi:hypothetical protein